MGLSLQTAEQLHIYVLMLPSSGPRKRPFVLWHMGWGSGLVSRPPYFAHTFYKSSTIIKSLIPLDRVVGRHGHLPGSMLALCQHRLPRPMHHPTLDLTMKRETTKLQIPSPAGIVGVGREVEKRHFYLEQGIQPALETKFYLAITKPVFFHPSFPLPLNMFTQISSSMKSKVIVILHFNPKLTCQRPFSFQIFSLAFYHSIYIHLSTKTSEAYTVAHSFENGRVFLT